MISFDSITEQEHDKKNQKDFFDNLYADISDLDKSKLGVSDQEGKLGNFEITKTKIASLSNEFADAFEVTQSIAIAHEEDSQPDEYYAMVYKKNLPVRIREIEVLHKLQINGHSSPVQYGVMPFGDNESLFFTCVFTKPKGKPLEDIVKAGIKLDETFILNKIVKPLIQILNLLHQNKIFYGSLNPKNIYIDKNGEICLAETLSTFSGFFQRTFYDTIERAQASLYGKGVGSELNDYYSLGMTIYFLLSGKDFSEIDDSEILRLKLHEGTYSWLNASYIMGGQIQDLVKGLVIDNPKQRWSYMDIDNLLNNRSYTVTNLIDKNYLSRAIIFNGKEFYSRKSLAHEMALNWDLAKSFLLTDKIKKWLEIGSSEEKFLEALETVTLNSSSVKSLTQKLFNSDDERLMRALIALDPDAPIRFKNIAFNRDGLGTMLINSINKGQSDITHIVASCLFVNVFSVYEILSGVTGDTSYLRNLSKIQKCSDLLKKPDAGFGLERILYELNPTLVCQHAILEKDFCIGIKDIIDFLEYNSVSYDEITSKKSIVSFIASKLHLTVSHKIDALDRYQVLQKTKSYQTLYIFSLAQQSLKITKLPTLCYILRDAVKDTLSTILRSSRVKIRFFEKIDKAAERGSINELYKTAVATESIDNDIAGYSRALRRGAEISAELFNYSNREKMILDLKKKALRYAVRFSYLACGFTIITIILQIS